MHHLAFWGILPILAVIAVVIWAAMRNAARHADMMKALEAQQALLRDQTRMLERIALAQEARK